jgi:hypothetical protein
MKCVVKCRLLGAHKLIAYALNEWLMDIKKNQLPSVMAGVGPMHSIVQLGKHLIHFSNITIFFLSATNS